MEREEWSRTTHLSNGVFDLGNWSEGSKPVMGNYLSKMLSWELYEHATTINQYVESLMILEIGYKH